MVSHHQKIWVTAGPAGRMLGVTPETVYKLAEQGHLVSMALPGVRARRFKVASIERFIAERSTPARTEEPRLLAAQN